MKLLPLPPEVLELLVEVKAPPRLFAHLRLVHDVACTLSKELASAWPPFRFDADAVAFGAATHDLGKALHPHELTEPGSEHEEAGFELLRERGFPEPRARFARTHARWSEATSSVEDLLVSLADKIWKGRREEDLEALLVARIAAATGEATWSVFMKLDQVLGVLAGGADERLALQASLKTGDQEQ